MNAFGHSCALLVALCALSTLPSCKQEPQPAPGPPAPRPATPTATASVSPQATTPVVGELPGSTEAQTIFKTRCVVCHGPKGEGNGTGAAALTVKPRNYTDPKWQRSVTDAEIEKIIVVGGGAVGKDPGMAANPDLKNKPEVVQDLRKIVRSFAPRGDAGAAPSASASAAPSASAGAAAKPKAAKPKAP